jgi:dihydropyrimidinase
VAQLKSFEGEGRDLEEAAMASLSVINGLMVTQAGVLEGGVWCEEGRIGLIGEARKLPQAETVLDARGRFVLPGLVDPHVHLGTGGSADEAKFLNDLATETQAAAAGGVTTIVTDHENAHGDSLITTRIRRDGRSLLEHAKELIESRSPVDVRYTANPSTPDHLQEIPALVEASVTSFKMFPSYVGAEAEEFGITTVGMDFIYEAMEVIGSVDTPWRPTQGMVHCEEPSICGLLKSRLRAANPGSLQSWAAARPAVCEAMQIMDVGLIAKEASARIYIPHVSSDEGVAAISYLKNRGVRIVGETCPHYLAERFPWNAESFGKVNPPVRGGRDREALWAALSNGQLEAIGSDNCRYTIEEKSGKNLWDAIPGFAEIALSLPLLLTDGIAAQKMSWPALVRTMAEHPARSFGMYPTKGSILPGADADLVIIDADEEWTVASDNNWYGADRSLYEGQTLKGRPVATIRRGEVVAELGWVAKSGGRYVDTPTP